MEEKKVMENNIKMEYNPLLDKILDSYPQFLSQNKKSNHYRYNNVLADNLHEFHHNKSLIKFLNNIERPLQIWRHQIISQNYTIKYRVQLENIKQITLYEKDNPIPLQDSGPLKDCNLYQNEYTNYTEDIIPEKQYYICVETWDCQVYQKGFPENDSIQNDIYDHDTALDLLGRLYDIPRRKYKENIKEKEYPQTTPPYNNSITEWDYCYQKRIQKHLKNLNQTSLPSLELEKLFEAKPIIEGRWKYIAYMDLDIMADELDSKYMATEEWNNNIYDVGLNLNEIPSNIELPSTPTIQKILDETFPLGSQIYFQLTKKYPDIQHGDTPLEDILNIQDQINWQLNLETDKTGLKEQICIEMDIPYHENINIEDTPGFAYNKENQMDIGDSIKISTIQSFYIDISSGFFDKTVLYWGKVRLDTHIWESMKYPNLMRDLEEKPLSGPYGWIDQHKIRDTDTKNFAYCKIPKPGRSKWLIGYDFQHQIPIDSLITGIGIHVRHLTTGPYHGIHYRAELPDKTIKTWTWTNNKDWKYYDGKHWVNIEIGSKGYPWFSPNNLKPAAVNHPLFSAGFSTNTAVKDAISKCDFIRTFVWWQYKKGTYTTPIIYYPKDTISWYQAQIDLEIPPGTHIVFDILNAENNQKLLENLNPPVLDLTSIKGVNIKIKAKIYTENGNSPLIKSINISAKTMTTI
jgi:hypothetical protein